MHTCSHYITSHYITSHYTTLHYTTLLHYYTTLHHYTILHHTTLHYTTLHYTTFLVGAPELLQLRGHALAVDEGAIGGVVRDLGMNHTMLSQASLLKGVCPLRLSSTHLLFLSGRIPC